MENPGTSTKRTADGAVEENILAILDSTEADDTHYANDDTGISFLDAVRAASLVPENGTPPTYKWFESIFAILRIGKSLELTMASFKLLNELDKRFPWVHLAAVDELKSLKPTLIVEDEFLGNMFLFQYLVNVFEGDFQPRYCVYAEIASWVLLRESLLNMLLVSRKLNYKNLMKDCLAIMCKLYQTNAGFTDDLISSEKCMAQQHENIDMAAAIALLEIGKNTCIAMQKFLIMIMELDLSRRQQKCKGRLQEQMVSERLCWR